MFFGTKKNALKSFLHYPPKLLYCYRVYKVLIFDVILSINKINNRFAVTYCTKATSFLQKTDIIYLPPGRSLCIFDTELWDFKKRVQ